MEWGIGYDGFRLRGCDSHEVRGEYERGGRSDGAIATIGQQSGCVRMWGADVSDGLPHKGTLATCEGKTSMSNTTRAGREVGVAAGEGPDVALTGRPKVEPVGGEVEGRRGEQRVARKRRVTTREGKTRGGGEEQSRPQESW